MTLRAIAMGTNMDVQVLRTWPAAGGLEPDYVRVHTEPEPLDDTVVLATIERVTDRVEPSSAGKSRVKTLLARTAMPVDAVLTLAKSYAARKHIPVVYAEPAAGYDG
jgi:hypothetical protein